MTSTNFHNISTRSCTCSMLLPQPVSEVCTQNLTRPWSTELENAAAGRGWSVCLSGPQRGPKWHPQIFTTTSPSALVSYTLFYPNPTGEWGMDRILNQVLKYSAWSHSNWVGGSVYVRISTRSYTTSSNVHYNVASCSGTSHSLSPQVSNKGRTTS
jgi:hypothetical protein